jgi:hypothetical protein
MKWLALAAISLVGLVVWFWLSYPSYTYRARIVIEIDTPSGPKTGSSVLSFTWRSQTPIGPRGAVTQIKGDAVFIDMGGGRNLIALLGFGPNAAQDRLEYLAFEAFKRVGRPMTVEALSKAIGSAPLTGDLIPTFVTFDDPNDPTTARVVRPDELERTFGGGVRFRGAFIELTNERVSSGIERNLAWWDGPFPWLKPLGSGTYVDTRKAGLKWTKSHFKRDD